MTKKRISTAYLLGLTLGFLAFQNPVLYAKDLQQDGTIKVSKFHKYEYSDLAKVTLQDAVMAVTKKFPGKAIEAALESEDGYLVYEVKVLSPDKKITKVFVDAGNSTILGTEQESKYFS